MDEQASFEPRSVLGRRRASWNRLALVVPALALMATAAAGLGGAGSDEAIANIPAPSTADAQANVVTGSGADVVAARRPQYPARVLGLDVERLDEVGPAAVGRGEVRAVAGWYVATTTIDCAPLAAGFREADAPEARPQADSWVADSWAYCDRFGLLYAANDAARRLFPNLLVVDAHGQQIASQIAAQPR